MAKAEKMTAKRGRPPRETDDRPDQDAAAIGGDDQDADFDLIDDNYSEWIAKAEAEKTGYVAKLYELQGKKKMLVDEWQSECPTEHDVGMKYGPGDYRLYLFPKSPKKGFELRTFRFSISQKYLRYQQQGDAAPVLVPRNGGGGINESVDVLAKLISAMAPLLQQRNNMADLGQVAVSQFTMMQTVMSENLKQNISLMRSLMNREKQALEDYDDDDQEGAPEVPQAIAPAQDGFLKSLLPLIETYAPKILGGGIESKITVDLIKALPQFSQITSDREKLHALALEVEKVIGTQKTREVLNKLGIQ